MSLNAAGLSEMLKNSCLYINFNQRGMMGSDEDWTETQILVLGDWGWPEGVKMLTWMTDDVHTHTDARQYDWTVSLKLI